MKKIRKIFATLLLSIMTLFTKIYGVSFNKVEQATLYGPPSGPMTPVNSLLMSVLKVLFIPVVIIIIIIIGLVIAITSNKNKK